MLVITGAVDSTPPPPSDPSCVPFAVPAIADEKEDTFPSSSIAIILYWWVLSAVKFLSR